MINTTLMYLRQSIRLLGLLMFVLGLGLGLYQWGIMVRTGTFPVWAFQALVPFPSWLRHASPLVQSLCGWPWIVLEAVPLPLACIVCGLLARRV